MKTNKNKLIMAIALVLTIIAIGAGTTYAYYVINIQGTSTTETITVGSATIGVTYENGKNIDASNILPGWSDDKLFNVTEVNTTSKDINYNISIVSTTNNFNASTGKLKATLKYGTTSGTYGTTVGTAETEIGTGTTSLGSKTMSKSTSTSGTTIYYQLHIEYPNNTSSVQAQTGSFQGYVNITSTASISN